MAQPTRPSASRASSQNSSRIDLNDDLQLQQAGRSTTTLNAYHSAQSLREQNRPALHSEGSRSASNINNVENNNFSRPNVLRKKSKPSSTLINTNVNSIPEQDALQSLSAPVERTRPVSPISASASASSPLAKTPSHTSSTSQGSLVTAEQARSRKGSHGTAGSSSESSSAAARKLASVPSPGTANSASSPSITGQRTPLMRPYENPHRISTISLERATTPRSVRDLGLDYSRYYNPFASRNNSQQDLTTPLPRYNSSTHLMSQTGVSSQDLAKRLSNPFKDAKAERNPFESTMNSAINTAPGTPLRKEMSNGSEGNEKGKSAHVNTAAVPATPGIIDAADPEKASFFPWIDDRLGRADYALPLFTDQQEDDDDMHMPQWDDDKRLKPKFKDHFTRDNIRDTLGMIFMLAGLLCIFVVLPVISYTGTSIIDYSFETPLDQMPKAIPGPEPWARVNDKSYPQLQNIRLTLIDPDTPEEAKTITSAKGDTMVLVFSDEFNKQNRTFYHGDDPFWFAPDIWYGATKDMEWYDPDAVNTGDGTLRLQLDEFQNHNLNYRSGMLNSWNQLCFKGGHFEVSMSLPGPAGVHGLWPGAWTMGNLGRPGYLATTDGLWPYTYNDCDTGITPNQSSPDGINYLPGQRLPSCSCTGEDHPTPGTGRGAPEIDIAEVSGDWGGMGLGVATQSFQVAPFDIWWYPNYEYMQTPNYNLSFVNTYTGGPYQQAVSTTSMLNNDWYDSKEYQKYSFEYWPGTGEDSGIIWKIGGEEMMSFDGRAIGPNGNIGSRLVSEEPMSMVLNLGFSHSWVDVQFQDLVFPTVMYVDYVRWYQNEGEEMVTCDPPGYETTEYIKNHPKAYNNPNYTHWEDAGYDWPKNTLMNKCSA